MDLSTGVAARLAALGLDHKGRLTPQLLASAAVRSGLLMDLALAHRLALAEDSIELDARPTGLPAADRLLLAMSAEPERTLDSWFAERRVGLVQVAGSLVQLRRWDQRRTLLGPRYTVGDPVRRERDLHLDVEEGSFDDPASAAVAAIGSMANLVGTTRERGLSQAPPEISRTVLIAAGEHAWVLIAALDHLRSARMAYAMGGGALGVTPGPG